MTDAQLNALWTEIVRTARPGARVIFRTAGEETILPGRVADAILSRFAYDREACRQRPAKDRSVDLRRLPSLCAEGVRGPAPWIIRAPPPPSTWMRIYRYQRYIYDASRKYYLLGRDRLLDELGPPPGAAVLEIACGTGRNLIKAAQRYPACALLRLRYLEHHARHRARRDRPPRPFRSRHRGPGRAPRISRRAPVRRAGIRARVHLLCLVDDPALALGVAAGACTRWRRGAGCRSSTSAILPPFPIGFVPCNWGGCTSSRSRRSRVSRRSCQVLPENSA